MTHVNTCTACAHRWPDKIVAVVEQRGDDHGNRWELSAHVWAGDKGGCPSCGCKYWTRDQA